MDFHGPSFVIAIIAITMTAAIIKTWIRAKHGYPLEDGHRGRRRHRENELADTRQIELLSNENGELKGKISRLEERIAVLERIATDPAERTAREIESLR